MLQKILFSLRDLTLAILVGKMIFFAFLFAPKVFKILPREHAGNLQANIFPAYYSLGIACLVIFLLSTWAIPSTEFKTKSIQIVLATLLLGIYLAGAYYFTPKITALQAEFFSHAKGQAPEPLASQFGGLHKASVMSSSVALLLALALLFLG